LVLIGINQVGSALIQFAPDVAKRIGIHRILPGSKEQIDALVNKGEMALNINFKDRDSIFSESRGDYWLAQTLCQTACSLAGVLEEVQDGKKEVGLNIQRIRHTIVSKLEAGYSPAVKEFCRGRRFRPSNDPYFKLLRVVSVKFRTFDFASVTRRKVGCCILRYGFGVSAGDGGRPKADRSPQQKVQAGCAATAFAWYKSLSRAMSI
jgi:hypothetical protein